MAVKIIDRLDLYHTIFTDPTSSNEYKPDAGAWKTAYNLANDILSGRRAALREILVPDSEHAYLAWMSSAFVPWIDAPLPQPAKKNSKAPPPFAVTAASEGIRAPSKICDILAASLRNTEEIVSVKDSLLKALRQPSQIDVQEDPRGRDTLGMALRRWGPSWRSQMLFAMMVEQMQASVERSTLVYAGP